MKSVRLVIAIALSACSFAGVAAFAVTGRPDVESVQIVKSEPSMRIVGSAVELTADVPTKFDIFSITGQLIRSVAVNPSAPAKIELAKGFYIVKCDSWTRRVMIK